MICLAVSTEYWRVTDGQTDRQTDYCHGIVHTDAEHREVKVESTKFSDPSQNPTGGQPLDLPSAA